MKGGEAMLQSYLEELRKTPLLEPDEERAPDDSLSAAGL